MLSVHIDTTELGETAIVTAYQSDVDDTVYYARNVLAQNDWDTYTPKEVVQLINAQLEALSEANKQCI